MLRIIFIMLVSLIVVNGCSNVSQNNTEKTKVTETEVMGNMQQHSNSSGGQSGTQAAKFPAGSIEFVKVQPSVSGDNYLIDLQTLQAKKYITFDAQGIKLSLINGDQLNYLPLIAFISPKGNTVLATSICEPCSGTGFHVEGKDLVCNKACKTRWQLEGLKGISGSCKDYPPELIKFSVKDGKMVIKLSDLKVWKMRPVM
jgi:uncharacterized protein YceK